MCFRVRIAKPLLVATCLWLAAIATAGETTNENKGINDFKKREPMATSSCTDETARLRVERYNAALLAFKSRHELYRGGKSTLVDVQAAAQRLMDSELAVTGNVPARKRVIEQYLALSDDLFRHSAEQWEAGIVPVCDRELMRQWHLAIKIKAASPMARDDHEIKLKLLTLDVQEAGLEVDMAETELAEAQAINRRSPATLSAVEIRNKELQVKLRRIALERATLLLEHHRDSLSQTASETRDRMGSDVRKFTEGIAKNPRSLGITTRHISEGS